MKRYVEYYGEDVLSSAAANFNNQLECWYSNWFGALKVCLQLGHWPFLPRYSSATIRFLLQLGQVNFSFPSDSFELIDDIKE